VIFAATAGVTARANAIAVLATTAWNCMRLLPSTVR
jgi:hypothetical protein